MEAPFFLSTVYVFIGENTALLDFMFAMNDTGLLNDGEYVVVAVDNSNDDPISNNTCEKFIIPHIFFRDINLRYATAEKPLNCVKTVCKYVFIYVEDRFGAVGGAMEVRITLVYLSATLLGTSTNGSELYSR